MAPPIVDGIPSHERVEPGSVNIPMGKFPPTATMKDIDAAKVAEDIITPFDKALSENNYDSLANLFLENSYFRDHLALSWDLRTLKGRDRILEYLKSSSSLKKVELDKSTAFRSPAVADIDACGEVKGVQFFITFETELGKGSGAVRLAETDGQWKIFTFFITLEGLKSHPEPRYHKRTKGVQHEGNPDRKSWKEKREAESELQEKDPVVLIIGAGQAGLTAAARLQMLGVDALIIDRNERVGDNWRRRYKQLVLHDPVWYDHMPYVPFPAHWPVFTPKDKLAEFFECYVKLLELNVWTKTNLKSATWDETKKQWTITLTRQKDDGSTQTRTVHPRHIIQATGHSGEKNFPRIKGMDDFAGTRLCHSSEFPGATPQPTDGSSKKKAIVVGSCNSGHDISQDFYEKGYDITMVQRSTTTVISSSAICDIGLKGLYDEDGPATEDADIWLWSFPSELFKTQQARVTQKEAQYDSQILEGLERVGFGLDRGPMGAGLLTKYFQRGGGYYIDVGASQLIAEGKIKIKQGQEISQVLPNGLEFADGTQLEADEIVFATGYQNMKTQAKTIFGDEVGDRVNSVWGFNEEGEFRTMWQKSGHPGLWFMGGNLALCRYYSRILALQIKAVEEGYV
ncbi:FAD/NAD(P)-binding domain-containing protein [Delitschia confertaspora ATCC 74209]|uniref:FAD/NAD(P)-binding domain-containing protein n=1 Tax=Delitschia confertaspora ATCC 74209 TaxID=1513339 RepID=A0A9P4JJL5_9PLEO|nr:FAD/NAD(P)-binding domain-containing protein [Delitschia confertaspora ATCC 74209]